MTVPGRRDLPVAVGPTTAMSWPPLESRGLTVPGSSLDEPARSVTTCENAAPGVADSPGGWSFGAGWTTGSATCAARKVARLPPA